MFNRFQEFETASNTQILDLLDDTTGEKTNRYLRTVLDLTQEELTNPELGLDRISKATDGWASFFFEWDDKAERFRYRPWEERARSSEYLDYIKTYLGDEGYFNRFLKVKFGKPRSPDPITEKEANERDRNVDDFINVRFGSER